MQQGIWWTADGWIHFTASAFGSETRRLYRVRDTGGAIEAEPLIGFAAGAGVWSLAQGDRRAVVRVHNSTHDLWVLRANGTGTGQGR